MTDKLTSAAVVCAALILIAFIQGGSMLAKALEGVAADRRRGDAIPLWYKDWVVRDNASDAELITGLYPDAGQCTGDADIELCVGSWIDVDVLDISFGTDPVVIDILAVEVTPDTIHIRPGYTTR